MKLYEHLAILSVAIPLASCAGVTPTQVNQEIADVQAIARDICDVVPTIASISAIISAGNPVLATADAIATAICDAVAPQQPAPASLKPMKTNGVTWKPSPVFINGIKVYFN